MRKIIPYGSQLIDKNDIKFVSKVLKSLFLSSGPTITKFKKTIKKYLKLKYVLPCNSGTSALMLAFLSIDFEKNCNDN